MENETAWVFEVHAAVQCLEALAGERKFDEQYGTGFSGWAVDDVFLDLKNAGIGQQRNIEPRRLFSIAIEP